MADDAEADVQNLRHLHALRTFVGNLVDQAEKSGGCECHKPPSLLLVGPPGVGKTYLVKQMSKVCELPLFGVHTNTVKSGASINRLFKQAREHYPSLVFLDDVESVFVDHDSGRCGSPSAQGLREEIFRELGPRKLKILDPDAKNNPTQQQIQNSPGHSSSSPSSSRSSSLSRPRPSAPELSDSYDESLYPDNNGIIVVAATSQPWLLYKDHELLSRFRGVYLVGLPDKQTRFSLLQTMLQELHHTLSDEDVWEVANQTQGFTPADLLVVIKTLSYRQLSFLLQPGGVEEQDSSGESSGEGSEGSTQATLSSLSETGSDTDIDGLSEPKNSKHRSADAATGGASTAAAAAVIAAAAASVAAAAGRRSGKPAAPAPPTTTTTTTATTSAVPATSATNESEGLLSRIAIASVATAATVTAAAAVAELARDWGSESDEEAGVDDGAERPAAVKQSSASPDSGMAESRSSEETIARLDQPDCPSIHQHQELQQQQHSPALTIAELLVTQTETNCMSTTQNSTADKYDSNALGSYRGDEVVDDTCLKSDESRTLEHQNLYKDEQDDDCTVKESDLPHESTDSDGFMLGNDTFSSSDCNERFSSDYFPNSSSTHTPPVPTLDDTEDHSAYDNVTPNDNSHHSNDDDDTYDKSDDNDTVFERDLVSSEEVDATGCTETEEVMVHPEYKSGPSPVNEASDDQAHSRSSTSSCSLPDHTAPAAGVSNAGADSLVIGSDGGVSSSNMTAVSADFTGTNGVDSITIHGDECSLELHYSEPPEGENMAVDDSDSDNDNDAPPVMRSRRVGFAPRPAAMFDSECNGAENSNTSNMNGGSVRARSPLSVNCGTGDLPPNIALDDGFTDGNGILRQLLSGPSLASTNGVSRTGCQPSPGASPTPPASPALSHCSSGAATLASSGSGRATPQRQGTRGPVAAPMWAQEQHGDEDQHQQVAHAPLQDGLAKRNGVDDRHHDSHHHHDTHNHLNHDSLSHPQQEQQQQKAREEQDQDQSAAVKGVSGLGAAAAAVAAVVGNGTARQQHGVSEDDMAKFLGALEATLDSHAANDVRGGGTSDGESCDSDDSGGAMPCIKPITLVDVMEVIAKDYRSVPDEEVKKYTEFMVWFANVAKSACPHNNGSRSEATTLDDDDLGGESTLCATPSLLRRNQRRRPLKKLGKFLLKALMFILD